jgi:DNA-directed RNA polymerase subunit RPC12/RpoP
MAETPRPSRYVQGEAQTLAGVLGELEQQGFTKQFAAQPAGRIRCIECGQEFAPDNTTVETVWRLEGASDPDDMLAVLPVTCPNCGARGTLVLGFGPEAPIEDSEILAALPPVEHPLDPDTVDG